MFVSGWMLPYVRAVKGESPKTRRGGLVSGDEGGRDCVPGRLALPL